MSLLLLVNPKQYTQLLGGGEQYYGKSAALEEEKEPLVQYADMGFPVHIEYEEREGKRVPKIILGEGAVKFRKDLEMILLAMMLDDDKWPMN